MKKLLNYSDLVNEIGYQQNKGYYACHVCDRKIGQKEITNSGWHYKIMANENGKKTYVTDETLLGSINKGLSAEDIQKKTDLTIYTLQTRYSELQFNSDVMLKKPAGLYSSPNQTEFKKLGVNVNRKKLMEFGFIFGIDSS